MGLGLILLGPGLRGHVPGREAGRRPTARSARSGWPSVYLLFTLGELCLSPIGLSLVNKLAPAQVRLADDGGLVPLHGVANYLAGTLGAPARAGPGSTSGCS